MKILNGYIRLTNKANILTKKTRIYHTVEWSSELNFWCITTRFDPIYRGLP
jgi:hypothetical protein